MYFMQLQSDPIAWVRAKTSEFGPVHAYTSVLGDSIMLCGPDALDAFFSAKEEILTIEALAQTLEAVVGPLPDYAKQGYTFSDYSNEASKQVLVW
jgi:hypothetical protein